MSSPPTLTSKSLFPRFYNPTSPTKALLLESVLHLLVRVTMIVPRSLARRFRSRNNQACSRITLLVSKELYRLGCRNIVVGGLPLMGCLPVQMTTKMRNIMRFCVEQENKDSVLYNQKLVKKLPEIEASLPGSKFLYASVYGPKP
ncbi:hypothetical protein Bca4012_082307 [Brassica carinata]